MRVYSNIDITTEDFSGYKVAASYLFRKLLVKDGFVLTSDYSNSDIKVYQGFPYNISKRYDIIAPNNSPIHPLLVLYMSVNPHIFLSSVIACDSTVTGKIYQKVLPEVTYVKFPTWGTDLNDYNVISKSELIEKYGLPEGNYILKSGRITYDKMVDEFIDYIHFMVKNNDIDYGLLLGKRTPTYIEPKHSKYVYERFVPVNNRADLLSFYYHASENVFLSRCLGETEAIAAYEAGLFGKNCKVIGISGTFDYFSNLNPINFVTLRLSKPKTEIRRKLISNISFNDLIRYCDRTDIVQSPKYVRDVKDYVSEEVYQVIKPYKNIRTSKINAIMYRNYPTFADVWDRQQKDYVPKIKDALIQEISNRFSKIIKKFVYVHFGGDEKWS